MPVLSITNNKRRRTLVGWLNIFKKKQVEEQYKPKKLTSEDLVYFIRLEDGACGQVKWYKGMIKNYPEGKYLLYLLKVDRDNAAFRLTNNVAEIL